MASAAPAEEVFRFSIVRNPQRLSLDKMGDGVIPIVPADAGESYRYFTALRGLREQNSPRGTLLAHAQRMLAAPEFQSRLAQLKTPLWAFVDRLYGDNAPPSSVSAVINDVFGKSASALANDAGFQGDLVTVADSLVLVSVVAPRTPGLRTRLMQARRAIALVQRTAQTGSDLGRIRVARILRATLLLPSSLFPIPDNNAERRAQNEQARQRQQANLAKETARAQRLLNELNRNTVAAEELSGALSQHLFERTQHQTEEPRAPSAELTVLPADRVKALSPASKKVVLDELHIPQTAIDVPFVVDQLEQANVKLGHQLTTHFGELLVNAGPIFMPGCGECKPVVLPPPKRDNDFTPDTRGEVDLVGVQDLLIVRQTLLDYRPGEISYVENVLQGEQKGKTHRKLDRTELTTVQQTEQEQTIENELQTTDKYELQTETSRTIQDDKSEEAGVTVTASYGSVNIEAHGNYAADSSTTDSRNAASTFARDVMSRSLQRIRESIFSSVTRTQITEVEVTNQHQFSNVNGDHHVTGIYRWLDKYYRAEIVNYGKRSMLEFMIPEPAAFYKYAIAKRPLTGMSVVKPDEPGFCRNGVFYPLSPADLQPENYLCFVGKYNVKNVNAPIAHYRKVYDLLKYKIDSTQGEPVSFAESNDSFKIPDGYVPKTVSYVISGGNSHSATTKNDNHDDIILAVVAIGDQKVFRYYKSEIGEVNGHDGWPDITQVIEWGNPLSTVEQQFGGYELGALKGEFALQVPNNGTGEPDVVKVSLTGHTTLPMSVTVHYAVLCERSPAKFQQWQIDTFNAIMDAYENLKADYDEAQQNAQNAVEPDLQGRNPALNRDIEKNELKKFSISLLTGQQYDSFNAMEEDYQTGIPQINLTDAAAEGRFVRFFEQAMEWKNMTYLFYPYFWGNKERWAQALLAQDNDPLFQQFLQAGFARVWVPVRPGFEPVVINYIECGGEPWNERDAPIVGEGDSGSTPTLSLIDEIKEQLGADFEFRPGTIAVTKNSKLVVGSGTDFRADDTDREILIALNYYRIASVDEAAQQLQLRDAYSGDDQEAIGYAIGVKFVGEPWVVPVPTTLVHLSATDPIIG